MRKIGQSIIAIALLATTNTAMAQVDYSVVSVDQEKGTELTRITGDNDYVCMPIVKRLGSRVNWYTNKIVDISLDGKKIAFLSSRNNTTNIFVKDLSSIGTSVQRTNRQNIIDFSYSPNGKYICFSEKIGNTNQLFRTNAEQGFVCRQITSNNLDYSGVYSKDMSKVYFTRQENKGLSIWSYDTNSNFLSSYTNGFNPAVTNRNNTLICARMNANGNSEIWSIDINRGLEECIVSDPNRSFTTPSVSPDGKWILMVGSNVLSNGSRLYANTDIFVCRIDGTQMMQLTFHAADDLSPTWSKNGKYIYFISQRGSSTATANIWRIAFHG